MLTPVWKVKRSASGIITNLEKKTEFVNQYSFHIMDPVWGHLTIKMSGHPPFGAQVILNGHEYVACAAQAAGIRFAKEDNCFTGIADPQGLAFIQLPVANLDRIEPRPLEDFVAIDVDDLLDRARVNAREAADALDELPLGLVRIGAPTAAAVAPQTAIAQARKRVRRRLPRFNEEDPQPGWDPVGR